MGIKEKIKGKNVIKILFPFPLPDLKVTPSSLSAHQVAAVLPLLSQAVEGMRSMDKGVRVSLCVSPHVPGSQEKNSGDL